MTGPKWSRATLDIVNNTFVVQNGLIYDYYSISCKPRGKDDRFITLETSPGVRSPGLAIVDKQVYDVSLDDLLRRRINVNKRRSKADDDGSETSKSKKQSAKSKATSNKQGSSKVSGGDLTKAADLAWEDQVDSLFQTFYTEEGEEIEITGSTQSGQAHEDSPVSGIFEDLEQD